MMSTDQAALMLMLMWTVVFGEEAQQAALEMVGPLVLRIPCLFWWLLQHPSTRHQRAGALILYESACDPDFMLGRVGPSCVVQVVRLCLRDIDLSDDGAIDQLINQFCATSGVSMHSLIECATWSSWQDMKLSTKGPKYRADLEVKPQSSRRMLMAFTRSAAMVFHLGGDISLV